MYIKEHRPKVLENTELRRISGSKGVKWRGVGGWRKRHNEALRDLYFLPGAIRIIRRG
jgi:hypothetical protein